jgi:hypothetical protein
MNKSNNITVTDNLVGNPGFKAFLEIQASYGFAQRGGVKIPVYTTNHSKRIASDVNLLDSGELKKLVFSETLFNN